MRHNEDRELVPLKSDFDTVWYGYRRSQVKFYIQQTENEIRLLTEDRDSALSQVDELAAQLNRARAEVEALKQQLDDQARKPIEAAGLSDRLRRLVRLAQDEANEVLVAAQAAAEHEWARSEQAAAELRDRYEKLVAEADEWRRQSERQRNEMLARTREEVQAMAREAEQSRRRLDVEAEERRTQVEHDFEVSMAARREEAMRIQTERERKSREEAQRRVREATAEAERRIRDADEYSETMLRMRQDVAARVRAAQQVLATAEPFLAATEAGVPSEGSDAYVGAAVHTGQVPSGQVSLPKQRVEEPVPEGAAETAEPDRAARGQTEPSRA
ncbi:cellulose-binding protein [Saccharopolyspora phatthalungensis]|uniref:Chromosome segregation ATPase n=1 Tax=Saccharopolyspora phatthalungensis TaxID=664693 RepID=A0A840Q7B6_9PSEU|nr:cellulose-binding protein [Saccharopolyspora phatthalungensis]MBB5156574.1 chromosome segregation ATPase [Saccharopolyspora phatthalungensis]